MLMSAYIMPKTKDQAKYDGGEPLRPDLLQKTLHSIAMYDRKTLALSKSVYHEASARAGCSNIRVCIVVDIMTLLIRNLVQHRPVSGFDVLH